MGDSNTRAVRQVLFNELGLTKESVEKEMKAIVQSVMNDNIDKLVHLCFIKIFSSGSWRARMQREAMNALEKEVGKAFNENYTMEIKEK